jgi:regulatory protein
VRREHSRSELARKLVARGIAEGEANDDVARMAEAGWQVDQRFACSIARSRAAGGYGPAWIRAELGSHGIGEGLIDQAFAALAEAGEDDWAARARDLVERRFAGRLDSPAGQRKAADFLYRRGFDGDCVRSAVRG